MPNNFGGDQSDPDYAPHLWLGPKNEHFVGNSAKQIEIGKHTYRVAEIDNLGIVAERWRTKDGKKHKLIPADEVPDQARNLLVGPDKLI